MKSDLTKDILTLRFEEDLISTTVKRLGVEWNALVSAVGANQLIVADLSEVEMIDSQGLNFLISLYKDITERCGLFKVTGASPTNQRLLEFVNLTDRFGG
jgi:anti-anti-sigma factor